jgi:hypothetical protein
LEVFFCLESKQKTGTIEVMKISGVLVLFPLTIVLTFSVLYKQRGLERPFERHAGAYTDVAHLVSAVKNIHQDARIQRPALQTIPRRPNRPVQVPAPIDKEVPAPAQITIAATNGEQKEIAVGSNPSPADSLLEEIWQDHISQTQAASVEVPKNDEVLQTIQRESVTSNLKPSSSPALAGLMSPSMQNALAQVDQSSQKKSVKSLDDPNLARLDVLVLSANINQSTNEIDGVDFVSLADGNDIVSDDRGRFTFEYLLNSRQQILSGVFNAPGHISTRVDLPLEIGSFGSLIPLMSVESMEAYLNQHKLAAPGGFILVDLDREIIDVEIDKKYQHKSFLDANMKITEADESARFALFAGVAPGNVMIRYLVNGRDIVERVAMVASDQVLYDMPVIAAGKKHSFGLYEMESLSLTPRELAISGRAIRSFNRKSTAVQDALNFYTLELRPSVVGNRTYTEVDHLRTTFFVGHHNSEKLVVPGQGFLNEVLAFHGVDSVERECMVQLNLPRDRELLEIKLLGEGGHGPLALDQSYLNRDGTVSLDATEFSTHAFILGDLQGQIYLRLDYVDGTVDFLNSFCVPGTYLVEQL